MNNISNGKTLIIFPQGTRVPHNENVPLKKGARRIYETLNIACIPIQLDTDEFGQKQFFEIPWRN